MIEKQQDASSSCVANSWFEVLSVVHMMAMLALSEADTVMIPKDHSGSSIRTVSSGYYFVCMTFSICMVHI